MKHWMILISGLSFSCVSAPSPQTSPQKAPASDSTAIILKNSTYTPTGSEIIGFSTPDTPDIPVNSNDVTDAIEARKHEMADCHSRALTKSKRLAQGRITFDFRFAPAGGGASVVIHDSTVRSKRLEKCSLEFMKSLKFRKYRPPGGQTARIFYPFRFVMRRN